MAEVGTLTKTTIVHYSEESCGRNTPHAAHHVGSSSSSGTMYAGVFRGEKKAETMHQYEMYCPGIRGTIEV